MNRHVSDTTPAAWTDDVWIPATRHLHLDGTLDIPEHAQGLVLFAHGSGSSRLSPRNRHVARVLHDAGLATLLFDLLTRDEERIDQLTGHLRFDIHFLVGRLQAAARWAAEHHRAGSLRQGLFGASTGAAAALIASTIPDLGIAAVVSRGGRPDLAEEALANVVAPTLLIVGGEDTGILPQNNVAFERIAGLKRLEIIPGATHLFDEPGALEQVAQLAADWFTTHLPAQGWHP